MADCSKFEASLAGQPGLQKETFSQDKQQNPKQGRGFVCGQYSGQDIVDPQVKESVNIRHVEGSK